MAEGKDGRNKIVAMHDTKRTLGAEAGDKKKGAFTADAMV